MLGMLLTFVKWFCIFVIILIKSTHMISPYVYVGLKTTDTVISDPITFFEKLLKIVAREFGIVETDNILSKNRSLKYVQARQMISCVLKKKYDMPLKRIGILLGKRDHSTIINNCNRHDNDYIFLECFFHFCHPLRDRSISRNH